MFIQVQNNAIVNNFEALRQNAKEHTVLGPKSVTLNQDLCVKWLLTASVSISSTQADISHIKAMLNVLESRFPCKCPSFNFIMKLPLEGIKMVWTALDLCGNAAMLQWVSVTLQICIYIHKTCHSMRGVNCTGGTSNLKHVYCWSRSAICRRDHQVVLEIWTDLYLLGKSSRLLFNYIDLGVSWVGRFPHVIHLITTLLQYIDMILINVRI